MTEYNKLNEKFVQTRSKADIIQGLMMAQAMAARMLIETNSSDILNLMGNISKAIENLKNDK